MPVLTPALRLARLTLLAAIAVALFGGGAAPAQAKVGSSVSGQLLTVVSGRHSDQVTVVCSGGLVKVNGKDPRTGPVACSRISEVDAVMGGGNDRVNFSGVGSDQGFGQRDLPGGFGHGTGCGGELGSGNDRYIGGKSCFNLVLGGPGSDRISGGDLRDDLQGGAGNDTLAGGAGRDVLLGNSGNDTINGGADDDLLSGNSGNDFLIGGPGNDLLGGGKGDDHLAGGPGDDELVGGPGKDVLNGGPGNNTLIQDSPNKKK
jgi:Ca2+-binding RTX toxin-like protein